MQQWNSLYERFTKFPKNCNQNFLNAARFYKLEPLFCFKLWILSVYHYDHTPIGYVHKTDPNPRALWLLTRRYYWWKVKCLNLPRCLTFLQVTVRGQRYHKTNKFPLYLHDNVLAYLTHFRPMFHLCRNQVIGFYQENAWKAPVEEWHSAIKNQLPGLSVSGTLVENGLRTTK